MPTLFSIIENNPRRLAQIKGISPKMAGKIHEQYMGLQTIRGVIISLQKHGAFHQRGHGGL